MHFVEVAIQNVRGFSPGGRFPLKPGYFILKPPSGAQAPLAGLALSLLYADGRGGEASFLAPGEKTGKAGLTLLGQDGGTYSLIRELGGAGVLRRIVGPGQPPEMVSQDAGEMGQFLRAQGGLPSRSTFEQLFCFQPSQFPSRRPRPRAAAAKADPHGKLQPSLASANAVTPAEDLPTAEARLEALQQELVQAKAVDALQVQVDEVASQLFEVESQLKSGDGVRASLREAESAHASAPTPERVALPPDILERLERFPQARAKRDEALAKLDIEREEESRVVPSGAEPLQGNRLFWASLAAGALFLGLGLSLTGPAKYVALLDIPAFGIAAMLALRYVDDLQKSSRGSRKEGMFAAREKKIQDEFQAESSLVQAAYAKLKVQSPEEVVEVLGRKAIWAERLAELRAQVEALEADPALAEARSREAALKARSEALNAELMEKGAYTRDPREVEREMARVKESIALAKVPPLAPAGSGSGAAAGGPLEDPTPQVLTCVAELLSSDVPSAAALMKDRCLQYFTALTDRRYTGLTWDAEGRATLQGAQALPAGLLPTRDLDIYYVALRLTAVEKVSARTKVPLLLEDLFVGLEEVKLPLLGRMLKHLGTLTQVLHVTRHPGFGQMADGSINV